MCDECEQPEYTNDDGSHKNIAVVCDEYGMVTRVCQDCKKKIYPVNDFT